MGSVSIDTSLNSYPECYLLAGESGTNDISVFQALGLKMRIIVQIFQDLQ